MLHSLGTMPAQEITQQLGERLAVARRRLMRDGLLALVFVFILSALFIHFETFEGWYQFSRRHENWEMDEFACIIFATATAGTLLMLHYLRVIHRLLLYVDATEKLRQRESEALARQERMAALGKLSGGMAHEINNALQPVLGLGDFVRSELESQGNDKHVGYMDLILSSAQHTKGIIENVLNYAREHNLEMESEPISKAVPEILNFVTDILQSTTAFEFEEIEQLESPRNQGYSLYYSKTGLRQVFMNLIKNAAESVQEGGTVTIRIGILNHTPATQTATLAIHVVDHGCGMDEETQKQIFQPFFTTKDVSEGTGLGLSSALGIVQMHKGTIRVESAPGKGSTFSVLLPITMNIATLTQGDFHAASANG